MALVLFEKPTAPERIPVNRDNSSAFRLDVVLDTAFVDEVHDDADQQAGSDGEKKNMQTIHGPIMSNGAIVAYSA